MKDLFKGHHPWLLVLVIAVDIFSALTIRHSILSKGESEFNANVFFFIVIVAGLALYALLVEFLSGKDMPLIGETEEKEAKIVQQIPVSQPVIDINSSTPQSKERPLSRGDFEDMMLNVVTKLRQETAIPPEASLKKHDETGVVSFNINDMKESAASLVQSQEDAKYRFACEYTAEKLGPYVKPCDLEKLFFRLGLFQRASSPNWDSRTPEEIEANIPAARIEVASPIEKWALLHFGWNMGRLFGKPNNFINHFLKTTFHYHLDGLSDNQLPKKLKQNPLQGVIKIEERFDKGLTIADYNIIISRRIQPLPQIQKHQILSLPLKRSLRKQSLKRLLPYIINPIHQSLPKKNRKLPNQRKPKNQQMKNATITMILTTTMRIEIWIMTTMSL